MHWWGPEKGGRGNMADQGTPTPTFQESPSRFTAPFPSLGKIVPILEDPVMTSLE